jgi:hypothetical protein
LKAPEVVSTHGSSPPGGGVALRLSWKGRRRIGWTFDDILDSGSRNEVQLVESVLCDVPGGLGVLCVSGRSLMFHGTILVAGAVD